MNEDNKKELFSSIKNSGLQDSLKKSLRIQICQKLKEKDLIRKHSTNQQILFHRVVASLLAEELAYSDCPFSESLFVSESGYEQKVFSRKELVELMALKEQDLNESLSLLGNILQSKYPFSNLALSSKEIQTNPQEIGYSLQQRLGLIDQQYRVNVMTLRPHNDGKLQIQRYQQQLREQYIRNIKRFKQFQLYKQNMQISESWRCKFKQFAARIQEQYDRKMDLLRKKDKNLNEEHISKMKNLQHMKKNLEDTIRQKIDLLDMKNTTIKTQMQNIQRQSENNEQKHTQQTKTLNEAISKYQALSIGIQNKIDYEVQLVKLALQQKHQDQQTDFINQKQYIQEEYAKLMALKETSSLIQKENDRMHIENKVLRTQINQLKHQLKNAQSDLTNLGERIFALKEELTQSKARHREANSSIKEADKTINRMGKQISNLRSELQRLRETNQKNQEELNKIQANDPKPQAVSDLGLKLEALRVGRRKDIEKFKLGLEFGQ